MNTTRSLVIPSGTIGRGLLMVNVFTALIYFSWWFVPSHIGNIYLYGLLFFGELYHLMMAFSFWITLVPRGRAAHTVTSMAPGKTVNVFITVAGEPYEVIKKTALAAKNMIYPSFTVYLLNDGYVAGKSNWREAEEVAREVGIFCITRKTPGGAKAGNINNALSLTSSELVVIFDADMAPHEDFLQKTVPYFSDEKVGFVQTPQFYKNAGKNMITGASWEQQELFFGPILQGKDQVNSAFICGTNVVISRQALSSVGGMVEDNIAEDFLTSLYIHQKGWKSYYRKEVLAEGLAPEDLQSYYKQQLRWARGSLEVLFGDNPFFKRHLTFMQRLQYLSSGLYWCNGVVVVIDALMPLLFLFTGIQPVAATTTSFAIFFLPFMGMALFTLYLATNRSISFRAISFSQASFFLQLQALLSVLLRRNMSFAVTSKKEVQGNFLYLAYPHILYCILAILAITVGIIREGINPSVATNASWALFNIILFIPYMRASVSKTKSEPVESLSVSMAVATP